MTTGGDGPACRRSCAVHWPERGEWSTHRAFERLKELTIEQCPRTAEAHLCVMHADDLDEAQRLASDLKSALGFEHIPIYSVGASITAHAGPGTLAVGFFAQPGDSA